MAVNRSYKDSVFSLYLSEKPERLIEVYNAVTGSNYALDTPIEINTLEDALWHDRINDLSFTLDGQMIILIEHQSTINENMPVRLLMYIARVYEKLLQAENIYRRRRIPLATPRFIVLYNGQEEYAEHTVQYLSESFLVQEENPALELRVDVYNINYETASQVIEKSESLRDYSMFVHFVNEEREKGATLEEAINRAVRYCIGHDIMREFLQKHGSEVENMLFTEWNMEDALRITREEGVEEGREEGRQEGREEGREEGMEKSILAFADYLSPEIIAKQLGLSLEKVQSILQSGSKTAQV